MSLKSPTFSRSFRTLLTRRPHIIWAFWILETCKTYCNHISIWIWHKIEILQQFFPFHRKWKRKIYIFLKSRSRFFKELLSSFFFNWFYEKIVCPFFQRVEPQLFDFFKVNHTYLNDNWSRCVQSEFSTKSGYHPQCQVF